jgi:nicotinate-nucleotide adenylyltransferase
MLNLSIEGIPHFECSDYEITKGDISFTYETILFYKKSFSVIELIIGFDNLQVFHKWYEPDKIIEHAKLIVMKRETDIPDVNNKYFKDAILINTPIIDISATKIRERVKNNLPINNLVPDKVKQYIFDNHLYQLP